MIEQASVCTTSRFSMMSENASTLHSLVYLPDEIVLMILGYLDVPDQVSCSRVNHHLRKLSLDPQLQRDRLAHVARWLRTAVVVRPTAQDLVNRHILLAGYPLSPYALQSQMYLMVSLSRMLRRDSLQKKLSVRPSLQELVDRGVIKRGGSLGAKLQALERQKVTDVLRAFFAGSNRPCLKSASLRGLADPEYCYDQEDFYKNIDSILTRTRLSVRVLTKMFSCAAFWTCRQSTTSSEPVTSPAPQFDHTSFSFPTVPTGAKVYHLKTKFEKLAKDQLDSSRYSDDSRPCPSPLRRQCTGVAVGAVATLRQQFLAVV